MQDLIFYKLATQKENTSQTAKRKAFEAMPDKQGYIKVFMPYGFKGKGFYYQSKPE